MKRILLATTLFFACSSLAQAQSWTHSSDRATAPKAIAGDGSSGFEIVCYQGDWMMYLFGLPTAEGAAALITVDEARFPVEIIYGTGSDGIALTPKILDALKSGNSVQVSSSQPSSAFSSTYSLRGSSRALKSVAAGCGSPTPDTAPDRFVSPGPDTSGQATALAKELLAADIKESRDVAQDPDIDIVAASFVDMGDGLQFLIADIGMSSSLFGVEGFYKSIFAKQAGSSWALVDTKGAVAVYFDTRTATNGYPDIYYQSQRGLKNPYGVWTWTGTSYAFSRNVAP